MNQEDHRRVSAAVAAAEMQSAGEIVTIVSDRSDAYHDVALHWAIVLMLMVPAVFALFPALLTRGLDWLSGGWSAGHAAAAICATLMILMVIAFLIARVILAWQPLRLALTPRGTRARRVRRRAIAYFKVGAERRTVGRTGILIYLSMAEHQAEIVADEAIHSRVAPEVWGDAMAALIDHVRAGRVADGMIAAIDQVGAILAAHFPRADHDRNELPDRLIEL